MSEISFHSRAYSKLILHAIKYPYCAVNGVLLAKAPTGKGRSIEFVDAVPLFHTALNLTPMAEVALIQIDQVAAQQGLIIAGYYVAHENLKESSFERSYNKVTDKIAENFGNACLVVVDNSNLGVQLDNLAIKVAQYSDGKYKPVDIQKVWLVPDHSLDVCTALINNRSHELLVDFDNHLDNISLDWLNHELNSHIEDYSRL